MARKETREKERGLASRSSIDLGAQRGTTVTEGVSTVELT